MSIGIGGSQQVLDLLPTARDAWKALSPALDEVGSTVSGRKSFWHEYGQTFLHADPVELGKALSGSRQTAEAAQLVADQMLAAARGSGDQGLTALAARFSTDMKHATGVLDGFRGAQIDAALKAPTAGVRHLDATVPMTPVFSIPSFGRHHPDPGAFQARVDGLLDQIGFAAV